jgi:transposase
MTTATRRRVLEQTGLLHPRPEAVIAPLFGGRESFFLALDKVQVKYEMLRAHVVDGLSATAAAEQHGYSRAAFYLITAAFDEAGMRGLLDEPRGRRGPLKLTPEVIEFVASADPTLSGAQLASEIKARFGVSLHRRTVERTRR